MPQIRVMDDDLGLATEVVDRLVQLLTRTDSGLRAGSVTRLRHRSGGGRFVLDVMPDDSGREEHWEPIRVQAERVDRDGASRCTPRGLPPGGGG